MTKIIVSVTNDLSTDQRVEKVCATLHKNGFEVILVGRYLKNSKPFKRNYSTKRFKLIFNKGPLFYAEFNTKLFFFLLFSKKDVLLSNDLDTLLPNFLISKLQQKKLIFDSHELFSEIPELVDRKITKQLWLAIENWIVPKLTNTYTVCNSIAKHYKDLYKTDFVVIKNLPIQKEITPHHFPFNTNDKKIILYQGAVNIGRGLELLIDSMMFLNNHLLVIIGDGDILHKLKEQVTDLELKDSVYFLGKITPKELYKLTPLADLGISLEEDLGLNYRYALPNKIFDYIQAEVPILVSDLPEMKQVVLDFKVGEIATTRNSKELAKQIKNMSNKDFSKEIIKAKKILTWEQQETTLLKIFKSLM